MSRSETTTCPLTIILNGKDHELPGPTSARDLISAVVGRPLAPDGTPTDGTRLGIAVAIDDEVIPRSRWAEVSLSQGQKVDVVTPMQGG